MKTSDKIERAINRFKDGEVFGYAQLGVLLAEYSASAKALERLVKKGLIKRASTGRFYKPEKTPFGELKPAEEQLLRPYLFEGTKRVAYITGAALYNKMGLTTQVPRNIKVASRGKRITTRIGNMQVRPVKSYVDVRDDNYYLLELLDAIKDFKEIPDTDKKAALEFINKKIGALGPKDRKKLISIALQYPPRVRALLGGVLSTLRKDNKITNPLLRSLHPLSQYDFGIRPGKSDALKNWKIS